jgi:hypothetical protein
MLNDEIEKKRYFSNEQYFIRMRIMIFSPQLVLVNVLDGRRKIIVTY